MHHGRLAATALLPVCACTLLHSLQQQFRQWRFSAVHLQSKGCRIYPSAVCYCTYCIVTIYDASQIFGNHYCASIQHHLTCSHCLSSRRFIVGEQLQDFPAFLNADGHITGPAIYQFQQVEARGAVFWEPLLLAIGLAESYRVALGWATPTGTGFNALKDDYEMGNLG